MKLFRYAAIAVAAALAACSHSNGWKVEGTIENADKGSKIAIDGFNGIAWYPIDSLEVDAKGNFKYAADAPLSYPDIYRIAFDGKSIYFPVDSAEVITITTNAQHFDRDYVLQGSPSAQAMMQAEQIIAAAVDADGVDAAIKNRDLKRQLAAMMLEDSVGSVSYYLLNKMIGNQMLFAFDNREDVKVLGAVANKFTVNHPNDPRTQYLKNLYLSARKQFGGSDAPVLEAQEVGLLEIELPDRAGKTVKLSDVAKNASVTLLSFTDYSLEQSPAYNIILNELLTKYKDRGIAIYQVGLDSDEVFWMQAANSLPWITVRGNTPGGQTVVNQYVVDLLPLTFVIDGNGDLRARIENPSDLSAEIEKVLR